MKKIIDELKKTNTYINTHISLEDNFEKLLNDKDFKAFILVLDLNHNLIIKNLSKLKTTFNELKNCKECKSLLVCKNNLQGFVYYPEAYNENIIFSYMPCKYQKDYINNNKHKNNIYCFDVNEEIKNAKMSSIYKDEVRFEVVKWINKFIKSYESKNNGKGLYLHGSFGCGKTYMISAMLNELAKKGVKIAIVYYPEFLRNLKSSFDDDFDFKFKKIQTSPLLLLDDIGAENVTSWNRDEVLGTILQYRMEEKLPTFFTSNLSIDDLEKHFAQTKDIEDKLKARRIIERIRQLSNEIKLVGENKRK